MRSPPTLLVNDLRTQYWTRQGWVHAVNGVGFMVGPGEIVGLVGESGSGKSATVRSVIGLIRPPGRIVGGSVQFDGRELLGMKQSLLRQLRGAEIGFVGQSPFAALNPVLNVESQFRNVLRAHRRISTSEARELALNRMRSVGIAGAEQVLGAFAHELSGGIAQRVVIAIAMSSYPKLLIADEPTTALDVTVQRQVLDLIRALAADGTIAVLLVTHDLSVVAQYCDRVVVMYAGKVVEQGFVKTVFGNPAHPYTLALLNSVPRTGRPLVGLRGAVPNLIEYPTGCPYLARCPLAIAVCASDAPELRDHPDHLHQVSCHVARPTDKA